MEKLEENERDREQHKIAFGWILKIASMFDYFNSSLFSSNKSPFYKKKSTKSLKNHLEFVDVIDEEEYYKLADKGYEEAGRLLGVASK